MLFLGIISWNGVSYFNGGGGGVAFQMGGFIFVWGGNPWEASVLVVGESKKILR